MSADMESRIKLRQGETLKLIKSESKGSLTEMDVSTYAVVDASGGIVGSVVHTDYTSRKAPFRRTQSVIQRDSYGAELVNLQW